MERKSGILLPVSSLPSRYGIGCFSREAYEFVDYLVRAGQTYWQILPLGQTGYGDSPYQSFSTFAGNPYFIDPEKLIQLEYISREEADAADCSGDPSSKTDGRAVIMTGRGRISIALSRKILTGCRITPSIGR